MASKSAAAAAQTTETQAKKFVRPDGQGPSLNFIRPSKLTASDMDKVLVEGLYIGSVRNEMTDKDDFKFELEDGSQVLINGAGNLGYRMSKIPLNTLTQVIYKGRQEITSGPRKGKSSHNFDVLVAE
jgi:hypothetical protein